MGFPYSGNDTEISSALDYLQSQQGNDGGIGGISSSSWAVMAIKAAGEEPNEWKENGISVVDYLIENGDQLNPENPLDYAKYVLAMTASGVDPKDIGKVDYVEELTDFYDGSQIGDDNQLNDDFWAVLALVSAGEPITSDVIQDSLVFIKENQNLDGGWSWGIGGGSDVDDTSAAIMALIAAGEDPGSSTISHALAYLSSMQNDDGGFPWSEGYESNSASTSWAICAIVASGEDPTSGDWTKDEDPISMLLSLQTINGYFKWTSSVTSSPILMTSYAIPALTGKPYPVLRLRGREGVTVHVRIEGAESTIWSGLIVVNESEIVDTGGNIHILHDPTPLGALDKASEKGGFSYQVESSDWGLYVSSINDEEAQGLEGWMYRINYDSPPVGADQYILNQSNDVLWYYGSWDEKPLKISVDDKKVSVGEEFKVNVTYLDPDEDDWLPLEDAIVHVGGDTYRTDSEGIISAAINLNGTYEVYAEKEEYIRSKRVNITVTGEGGTNQVTLKTTIIPAVSIRVSPTIIDFGKLGPGYTSEGKIVEVYNIGSHDVRITTEVTDRAKNLFVNGIWLEGDPWQRFTTFIEADPRDFNNPKDVSLLLMVPTDYEGVGSQEGTVIFWAEEA